MSMSFKQGLIHARSHIAMILGLLLAFGLVTALELWDMDIAGLHNPVNLSYSDNIPAPQAARLTEQELQWARVAWRYFENNYQADTGLVNSVNNYPATTMWDTASYLMALISAYRLELISPHTFDTWLSNALTSLGKLELFDGQLPNKSYNTQTLAMSNYDNSPNPRGIGWSAIDIGRLLVPLSVIAWEYPQHTPAVQRILKRWQWSALVDNGRMMGATVDDKGKTVYVQEGRLGYEQYAARALRLFGLDMGIAGNATAYLKLIPHDGIDVPTDVRDSKQLGAYNYVVSEPYILDGLEFGGAKIFGEFAWRVYRVQEEHYKATGIPTAVSEDHIDDKPYFVYNTVFVDGGFWRAITDTGENVEQFKSLSTKAVFGWHALYRTDYTTMLMDKIKDLYDAEQGWYSGLYEQTGKPNKAVAANTNAIVLESLAAMQFGKLTGIK